jgi:tetratricopeptide (TPR) repeat protein
MILSGINAGAEATRAGAEGQAALSVGETDRAKARFGQAGKILAAKVAGHRKQPDKHLSRFLAASQYYQGGHYQKALDLSRKVEAKFLPVEARPLFEKFLRDVKDRAAPGYADVVRKQLTAHWLRKDYEAILTTLQDHPYVINQSGMAYMRASCCERLGDYHGAAVFFADAVKTAPDNAAVLFTAAGYPLRLVGNGELDEAWKYVSYQLKATPNAITFLTASNIRFHQAHKADGQEETGKLLGESVRYFEQAWRLFQQFPAQVRDSMDLREYMILGFEIAALSLNQIGDSARALDVCSVAVSFAPNAYGPKTVRGIITYPDKEAVADFRRAIELGDPSYYAYYYLAHTSMVSGDYEAATSLCQQALQHAPSRRIEAQLHFWLSIAQQHLGAELEVVRRLLQRAIELDPDNPLPRHHLEAVEASGKISFFSSASWDAELRDQRYLDYLKPHETKVEAARSAHTELLERELAGAAA